MEIIVRIDAREDLKLENLLVSILHSYNLRTGMD